MTQFPALDDLKMQEEMVRRLLRMPHPKGMPRSRKTAKAIVRSYEAFYQRRASN